MVTACALGAPTARATAPAAPDPSFGTGGQIRSNKLRVSDVVSLPGGAFHVLGSRSTRSPFASVLQKRLLDEP